ncbi:tetratricopeptide repeat protein 28-like [Pocillopora verrucosa]|uniref:tetratricopeptide repeat protein 28-like n=1 Tax=Pocillopora verrucosa TaxID=203993 RepID=UPI00334141AE
MSKKRKRSVLSIKDKQIIISRLDKGEKGTNLALEFGISKQQISDIRKNKDKILKLTNNIETSEGLKRKSLKLANDERLDQALYTWFIQQRSTGTPISGPLLQGKAKHFSMQLNGESADHESFKASTGWLDKFKNRHGIRNLSIQGEKLAAAEEAVDPFLQKLNKPRCFKSENMDALPVTYKSQRNAWMNSEIFAEWLTKEFVPAVKRHQRLQNIHSPKALLLIDNCSPHPDELSSRDGSVTCMFLPPNTTPMDQGVLQAMKNRYKRKLLQKVVCAQDLDHTQSIKDIVKLHTVKDALYMQVGNEDSLNAHDLEDWLNLDNELPTTEQMSDEQILVTRSAIDSIKKIEFPATATEESQVTSSDAELDVDDDLLREIAKVSLEKGNREYRQEEANNAINLYTEGLRVNCKDKRMNAKLYSNRATAHFRLGFFVAIPYDDHFFKPYFLNLIANYVECLDDATVAVQLEPTLIKAIKKGARACVELCLYKEARSWLQMGLAIENDNKRLLQLLRTTNAELILIANSSSYLGNAYQELGKFKTVIKYHQRQLEIAKLVEDKTEEGRNYCNLGNTYQSLGQFKTAIQYHQRHLEVAKEYHQRHQEIAKEVGDKAGEGISYGNLSNAYNSLGQFKTAIQYHKRHLKIAKEVGDKAEEGISYGNLGNAYQGLGHFETAIQYHQRHQDIAKKVGDKAGEGISYGNLGNAYKEIAKEVGDKAGEGRSYSNLGNSYSGLGEFKTAIRYHQRQLEIAKDVGDNAGEGNSYANLGNAYKDIAKDVGDKAGEGRSYGNHGSTYNGLGQFKIAIQYHQRHLEIAKEVGDKAGEGISYSSLGNAYNCLGQFKTAIRYHQRHLEIAKDVGDKAGEGKSYEIAKEVEDKAGEGRSYGSLGKVYNCLGQFKRAIHYHERHLEIAKEVGDKDGEGKGYGDLGIAKEVGDKAGEAISYGNLGNTYQSLGQFKTAIEYNQRHLDIVKEVGNKAEEGKSYYLLGRICQAQRELKTAIACFARYLEISKEVGDKAGEACSLCSLGSSFECQGNLMKAFDCYYSSVELYDDIRASLQLNDQWKICYRNQHQAAYKGLWRINLNRGQVVEALFAAEKGRAQALRDLMVTKYQPGNSLTPSASRISLRWVPLSTVFIATSGPRVYLWVCLSEHNIWMREVHVNNYKYEDELECFIHLLNKTALKEIGARGTAAIENPSLDSPTEEDMIRVDVRYSQSSALKKLHDIIVTPIADLIEGNDEITFVPEGSFCLVPYAALQDSNSSYLRARQEVEMIGRILNVSPLTGEMATKDEVLKRISSVALVHIATHGKKETGEVILAPNTTRDNPQPQEKDYLLTMKDVIEAGLRARLVVLSCCDTARGEVMAEGVVGMARVLLGAGARSVVVTLWSISDEGTVEFMSFFYDALGKGKKASEALNQAMKCMREIEKFKKEIFWAPFVLIGDDVSLDFKEI